MFAINAAARVARRLLPTHDVATAYDEPHLPRFIDDKRPGGPQLVPVVNRLYFDVRPLAVASATPAAVFAAALEAAAAMGWEVTAEEAPNRFQALAVTRLMKFKDDIVVTVTLGEGGGGARVDARSRSRLGQGDMGANGARLVAYFNRLAAALAAAGLGPVSKL